MQVISIDDVKGNRSLSWSGQGGRTYSLQLRVITDDPTMGPRSIQTALGLRIGDQYVHPLMTSRTEWDIGSYIQSFEIREEGDDGKQWICTLNYGPFNWAEQGGATSEASDGKTSPFDIPPKVSFGTAKYEVMCHRDRRGKAIVNNVGDPFDPPLKRDDSRSTLTIVRNEPYFNSQYVQFFKDKCNQDTFLGTFAPNTVKCAEVTAEREHQADWGYFWVVTYHFEIRDYMTDALNNIIATGWTEYIPNAGLREWKTPFDHTQGKKPVMISGAPVTSAILLNDNGVYDPAADPVYLRFELYPLVDFTLFNFPDDLLFAGTSA